MTDTKHPLDGLRVIELGQLIAGPFCGQLLGDFGADVIKVEAPGLPDPARGWGAVKQDGIGLFWPIIARNKKSLTLNLRVEEGQALLKDLVKTADVLVENFRPGTLERWGLGPDVLHALNPRLVITRVSGYGQTGPESHKAGYASVGEAKGGLRYLIGEPDRSPVQVPIAMGDSATGVAAAMAVGFALLHRERTGEGQYIDCSLLDTYVQMHEDYIPRVGLRGSKAIPPRSGSQHPNGGPTGIYHAGDGQYIQVMIMPYQWPRMVAALDMPELEDDERFATPHARRENREALKDIIETWMAAFPGREAVLEVLNAERVPAAPVLSLDEVIEHPHLLERSTIRTVSDPHIGAFPIPGMPARFSQWEYEKDIAAPLLGEHNESVITELAGLDPNELDRLYEENVLVCDSRARRKATG